MRIVLLTRWAPWQIQAANMLHDKIGLSGVVVETYGPKQQVIAPSLTRRLGVSAKRYKRRMLGSYHRATAKLGRYMAAPVSPSSPGIDKVYREFVDYSHTEIQVRDAPVEYVDPGGISSQLVSSLKPDIVFVYGTSILQKDVIDCAHIVSVNLHWGLSPWYRGTHCTDWALLKGDIANIGVTLHVLDPNIDSGPVLSQARPSITANDSPFTIDLKLGALGLELFIELVNSLEAGQAIVARPQKKGVGDIYMLRDWSPEVESKLSQSLRRGNVGEILARSELNSRKLVPIVKCRSQMRNACGEYIAIGASYPTDE